MSSIFYDPTECREGSRLPQNIIKAGTQLTGLERITGADILITTAKFTQNSVSDLARVNGEIFDSRPVGEIANRHNIPFPLALLGSSFASACRSGILVQRKTGQDFTSSIPDFARILYRMQQWSSQNWLLFVGVKHSKNGKCIIDNRPTQWTSAAVNGAIAHWQLRGGYYDQLSTDGEIKGWCAGWLNRLTGLDEEKTLPPRESVQQLRSSDEKPWRASLLQIPGWGIKKVNTLAGLCNTLADALEWITCPDWTTNKSATNRPKGITTTDVLKARSWYGLEDANLQLVVGHTKVDNCVSIPEEK